MNLMGMGFVERASPPKLQPDLPRPAVGFKFDMTQCDTIIKSLLHPHMPEEVAMPLFGPRTQSLLNQEGEQGIFQQPSDFMAVSVDGYSASVYASERPGTLRTLIGGPDAGKVDWYPRVLARATAQGVSRYKVSEVGDPGLGEQNI